MAYITFLDGLGSLPKLSLFSLESDQHVKTQLADDSDIFVWF